jgi:CarD family transcriptional regulator
VASVVIKSLMRRDRDRGLSTGERRMLHFAKDILVSEMTVSLRLPSDIVENKLAIAVE